jgi:hypothetical protein
LLTEVWFRITEMLIVDELSKITGKINNITTFLSTEGYIIIRYIIIRINARKRFINYCITENYIILNLGRVAQSV